MCPAKPVFVSYSVNREDVILNRVFGNRDTGFYIDVGAAHPLYENDTKALYDRGWRGINIEPNVDFFQELVRHRSFDRNLNVAVSDTSGSLTFHQVVGTGLSTCDADEATRAAAEGFEVIPHIVEAVTLREILEATEIPTIDLLKVDVEGFELRVLSSNDWTRFRPKMILVEVTFPETPVRRADGVAPYLATQGYRHVYFDGLNDYYVEQDFQTAPETFDRPPNVFDHYETYLQHEMGRHRDALIAQVASLSEERENALAFISSLQTELNVTKRVVESQQALSAQLEMARLEATKWESLAVTRSIDVENARIELISMRERGAALAAQLEAAESQCVKWEATAVAHSIDVENARSELISMRERGRALATQLEASQLAAAEAEAIATRDRAAWAAATEELRQYAARVTDTLRQVYASTSWRITRPMRGLARPRRSLRILLGRPPE